MTENTYCILFFVLGVLGIVAIVYGRGVKLKVDGEGVEADIPEPKSNNPPPAGPVRKRDGRKKK